MALPADFPLAPKRPPADQPVADAVGRVTQAWANYLDKLDRFNAAVRAKLNSS